MLDSFTEELLAQLEAGKKQPDPDLKARVTQGYQAALDSRDTTGEIVAFFKELKSAADTGVGFQAFGVTREQLVSLCERHQAVDEHSVSIGGRVNRALHIAEDANRRVEDYLERKGREAPSGIELWPQIQENQARIRKALGMAPSDWDRFSGQLKSAINDVDTLARCIALPADAIRDVTRVTKQYRMRLTPYYASLITAGRTNDPVLLQAVPTAEMVDNVGQEIPPVAADHSPARLIDQFYPRVVTIKATNMCAMYCTHCLRIAHIGGKDHIYPRGAYEEALNYIRANPRIRDVLITGGDAFMLPNKTLRWLLGELDAVDHLKLKRLGTRVPVTTPQRVDTELLDILAESNAKGPLRVVTQINTAQEITPVSHDAFRAISGRVSTVLNQAVLLRGINDDWVKMWKLCETVQEAYVRPYYLFNCSFRNPQYTHMRVPLEKGRDIVESMYGNISGDAIPRYIATAGGKIPLHRSNVRGYEDGRAVLRKPWSGEEVTYPDADPGLYSRDDDFAFGKYGRAE
jgi:KamA family protein